MNVTDGNGRMSAIERALHAAHTPKGCTIAPDPADLCAVFGVTDPDVAARLRRQLLGVLRPEASEPVDPGLINLALAVVKDIGPTDATEALLAVMLVAAEFAAMDTMRRAAHPAPDGGRTTELDDAFA